MEPLFEAKAKYGNEYRLYNIYRIGPEKYKAQLISDEENDAPAPPAELVVTKGDGEWQIDDPAFNELGATLGIEIDAFNHGYGALLGRIGVR